jgi:hypothetical protein
VTPAGTGIRSAPRLAGAFEPGEGGSIAGPRASGSAWRRARWIALPFGLLYLILLAQQLHGAITTTNLDADAVSGPVISELFGAAPAHASVVLGTFGWYSTLLFDLATKWLPDHRQVWEVAPYAMALAGAGLAAWTVWQVAGRWAAALTAVLLVCASPASLRLLLSTTQHAPVWFCLALLGAFVVLLERRGDRLGRPLLITLVGMVGIVVGVNAASDALVAIAALAPFALALIATAVLTRGDRSSTALRGGLWTLAVVGVTWVITAVAMSRLAVTPEPGLDPTRIALGEQTRHNFTLWWKSIAVLGNGDFFGRALSVRVALAVACGVLSIAAVVLLPWLGWRQLRGRAPSAAAAPRAAASADPATHAFYWFWCSSAILLSLAFLVSAAPVDIHADRYLVGLLYAGAAVVPAATAGRLRSQVLVLAGSCVFALGGVVSLALGLSTDTSELHTPVTVHVADQIARIAAREHLRFGYAGYWDAAPMTWATGFGVQTYPVAVCDQDAHLCRFDLHFISSWYEPRPRTGSFLLTDDRSSESVTAPTPDLGRPTAVHRIGAITMYSYPYDLARRIRTVP